MNIKGDYMKIVINEDYGGFGLSKRAFERLIELGMTLTEFDEKGNYKDPNADIVFQDKVSILEDEYRFIRDDKELRTNLLLIQVVEELGEEANDKFSKLKIIEIPDDIEFVIEEYDGREWIAEKRRKWF